MGRILATIGDKPQAKKPSIADLPIRKQILALRDDHEELLMRLSGGDMNEYDILKKSNIRDFLNKFNIFVEKLCQSNKAV